MDDLLAVVTGTSTGFGAALIDTLAARGWNVVATSRKPAPARTSRVAHVLWDVAEDDSQALRTAVGDRPVDLLINNADTGVPGGPLENVRIDDLRATSK